MSSHCKYFHFNGRCSIPFYGFPREHFMLFYHVDKLFIAFAVSLTLDLFFMKIQLDRHLFFQNIQLDRHHAFFGKKGHHFFNGRHIQLDHGNCRQSFYRILLLQVPTT